MFAMRATFVAPEPSIYAVILVSHSVTKSQLITRNKAATCSGRRFWYFRS